MAILLANNANGNLSGAITAAATTITLQTGQGAMFPIPNTVAGDFFPVTLVRPTGELEICYCTKREGEVLTVTRARESTTAKTFSAGDRVSLRLTNGVMRTILDAVNQITPFANTLLDDASASAMRDTLEIGAQCKVITTAITNLNDNALVPYLDGSVITAFTAENPTNKPIGSGSRLMIQSVGLVTTAPNEYFYQKLLDVQNGNTYERVVSTANGGGAYTYGAWNLPTNGGGGLSFRNKIINGKMDVNQRGVSFVDAINETYLADRFVFYRVYTAAKMNADIVTDVPSPEFLHSLKLTVTTADATVGPSDRVMLDHRIEGYNARDLVGKTFTLSFWVKSPKAGTHCISFRSSGQYNSYVAEYTVNAANTWEKKTVTIVGGLITTGEWNWTTGVGLRVSFVLMCGSSYQIAAGSWVSEFGVSTANQVNCADTVGNAFLITGVQLEVGAIATPFEHRPIGVETELCQRYFVAAADQSGGASGTLSAGGTCTGTTALATYPLPVPMRATPTWVGGTLQITSPAGTVTVSSIGLYGASVICSASQVNTNGDSVYLGTTATSGKRGWEAELL